MFCTFTALTHEGMARLSAPGWSLIYGDLCKKNLFGLYTV